eukprot:gnl/TRDRNA2_/TRDRNA2_172765_c1_seq2.p1 gnl/TRDRNA2_/TRDRNA2_172765_c1~~gnl/TRDRNA2_/TRDRNA2_172765_c1_seq2.p1  ORF type:complete len:306 (+),score=84.62 gnl/TRDRNA2_/TRDRNA2_172765_c1_seq2:251-1168(+)
MAELEEEEAAEGEPAKADEEHEEDQVEVKKKANRDSTLMILSEMPEADSDDSLGSEAEDLRHVRHYGQDLALIQGGPLALARIFKRLCPTWKKTSKALYMRASIAEARGSRPNRRQESLLLVEDIKSLLQDMKEITDDNAEEQQGMLEACAVEDPLPKVTHSTKGRAQMRSAIDDQTDAALNAYRTKKEIEKIRLEELAQRDRDDDAAQNMRGYDWAKKRKEKQQKAAVRRAGEAAERMTQGIGPVVEKFSNLFVGMKKPVSFAGDTDTNMPPVDVPVEMAVPQTDAETAGDSFQGPDGDPDDDD